MPLSPYRELAHILPRLLPHFIGEETEAQGSDLTSLAGQYMGSRAFTGTQDPLVEKPLVSVLGLSTSLLGPDPCAGS